MPLNMKLRIWSTDLLEHPEGRRDLGHADETLRWVQKVLKNLEHADESTLKWRFSHWSLTLLQMCLYCLLLSGPEAWEPGQSAYVSLWFRVKTCCTVLLLHKLKAQNVLCLLMFSHWTETQHRVSLLLYNKEEIKRVWLKRWLESFIYTLLRILWQSIHMYRVQTWWRSAELSCVH